MPIPPVRRAGLNVNATPAPGKMYVGVDPGASGGLAVIYPGGAVTLKPFAKLTLRDLRSAFEGVRDGARSAGLVVAATLEKVGGYVGSGDGEKGGGCANATAMFAFGASYGRLQMCLEFCGFSSQEVGAAAWQKAMGVRPRKKARRARKATGKLPAQEATAGEPKAHYKKRLREFAEKLFPDVAVTADTADALLLAEFTRRWHMGLLGSARDQLPTLIC